MQTKTVIASAAIFSAAAMVVPSLAWSSAQQRLQQMRELVGIYVDNYQTQLSSVVASEKYSQTVVYARGGIPSQRTVESEVLMLRPSSGAEWIMFRDVFSVDGRDVTDRSSRLLALLGKPPEEAIKQGRMIAEESSRFNLGQLVRTTNLPDLALTFLQTAHAQRVVSTDLDSGRVGDRSVAIFRFRETKGPTIIRTLQGEDLPASGRIWADVATGAVLRTELNIEDRYSDGRTTVEFAFDSKIGMYLPSKMQESYRTRLESITAVATYSNFRKFEVSTTQELKKPPTP